MSIFVEEDRRVLSDSNTKYIIILKLENVIGKPCRPIRYKYVLVVSYVMLLFGATCCGSFNMFELVSPPVTFNPLAILSRFSLSLFCLTAVAPNILKLLRRKLSQI